MKSTDFPLLAQAISGIIVCALLNTPPTRYRPVLVFDLLDASCHFRYKQTTK